MIMLSLVEQSMSYFFYFTIANKKSVVSCDNGRNLTSSIKESLLRILKKIYKYLKKFWLDCEREFRFLLTDNLKMLKQFESFLNSISSKLYS